MSLKATASMPKDDREWQAFLRETYDLRVRYGTGDPENVVTANRGTIYMRIDGGVGTTMYSKEADDGESTGWQAK